MRLTRPALAAALALATLAAHALTLERLSESELQDRSERIVAGTVTDLQVRREDPDGDGTANIYTIATVRVDDPVKGPDSAGDLIAVRVFGGTLGAVTEDITGIPRFQLNERVVLFLAAGMDRMRYCPIVGGPQGVWRVRTENGTDLARRELGDAAYVDVDDRGALVKAGPPEDRGEEPLADLLARFRAGVVR
jgi:hypothetical protein